MDQDAQTQDSFRKLPRSRLLRTNPANFRGARCEDSSRLVREKDESAPIIVIALSFTCAVSIWESKELDERPHTVFLAAARKSFGSCELGDSMEARPKQFR
jgi:hypothetical protein